jgi:hypothetical protein
MRQGILKIVHTISLQTYRDLVRQFSFNVHVNMFNFVLQITFSLNG